jgi:predicted ABC-type exoprotein transport system permease subunit
LTLFVVFVSLAIYNAGCMTTLQLQHYGIYPLVGKENFAAYMRANNRAAVVPTILPALSLLIVSVALMVYRPGFIRPYEAVSALGLNLIALGSTLVWQRRIQGEMAATGHDEAKVRTLITTNWIRTAAHLLLAILVILILLRVLAPTTAPAF